MATSNGDSAPKQLKLRDGREVVVRQMVAADRSRILEFARHLPQDDLLFLRTDITDPTVVDAWIENIMRGNTLTLVAETPSSVAGYASVHREQARWTRRVGEIRVNVASAYRGAGLGRALASAIFDAARGLGLKKLAAMMTTQQSGARTAFERLGFHVEARLADWVEDRNGMPQDVLVMTNDLEGFSAHV